MQYGFYFDQTRCTGCDTCSVACKDWHDIPAGPVAWRSLTSVEKGTYPRPFLAYLSESCYHCEHYACGNVCPVGAITKDPNTGIVVVDSDVCLGRSVCAGPCGEACAYDVPQYSADVDEKMQKCTFCFDRVKQGGKPICVESCPLRCLDAGPMDELRETYGESQEATGFIFAQELKPSVIFKPKK